MRSLRRARPGERTPFSDPRIEITKKGLLLLTRSITTGEPCRCCRHARENLLHFAMCDKAGKIWVDLNEISGKHANMQGRERERFAMFALLPTGNLESVWIDLHLVLWKNLIGALVGIELEGETFVAERVWRGAWKRLEAKILALVERVNIVRRRDQSRGEEVPDLSKKSRLVSPIATLLVKRAN